MADETIDETIVGLVEALKLIPQPINRDEPIGDAIKRSPAGHPAREIYGRTVKCQSCGSLMPFYQLIWIFVEGRMKEPVCRNCSSSDVTMWKRPVAGHG